MPNLYNKLMAKDMPRAAAAPTSRQMVQAPMGLRSAMKRYAEGGETTPPPPEEERIRSRLREEERMRPPEMPVEPRYEKRQSINDFDRFKQDTAPPPRYIDTAQPPVEVRPEIYPQDYAGPRTSNTSQTQQVGPRTSYRQEADGTLTEIGYDGQPVAGYTPEQWAMHNATMGINQPKFSYVWNGEGYTKVPAGESMVNPLFSQNPEETVVPPPNYDPGYESILEPKYAYPEPTPEPKYDPGYEPTPEPKYDPGYEPMPEPNYEQMPEPRVDPRMEMLRKALSGQSISSIGNSQQLASLLQMLGYSK